MNLIRPRLRSAAVFVVAAAAPLLTAAAPPFREQVALDVDLSVVKQLAAVEDFVREQQWEDAVDKLRRIATEHADTLVPVRFGRYVTAERYADLLRANFPAAGLAAYRRRVDPQARQWFEDGRDQRNRALLERVVQQAFVSSYGDDALFLLGELAWDRGDPAAARAYWEQIVPLREPVPVGQPLPVRRYPDSDLPRAEVLARLILCSLLQGDHARAAANLESFATQFPQAEGTLAGRTGNLADLLQTILDESRTWPLLKPHTDTSTFAGDPTRNVVYPEPIDVGGELWSVPLPDASQDAYRPLDRRPALDEVPLSYFPVVVGDVVLVSDALRIYAFDLHTGQPKWPVGPENSSVLRRATVYELLSGNAPPPEVVGVPRFTLTVAQDRIYARMGTPVTSKKTQTFAELSSRIVCLDLATQGKELWHVEADALSLGGNLEGSGWFFDGTPVVVDGRVFVALRRSQPQMQAAVVCLDAETGALLWERSVAASVSSLGDRHHSVSHHLLTVAENVVYFSTEMGAIAAIDCRDGRIRWVVTYETRPQVDPFVLSDPTKNGLTPCTFHRGLVFAAPGDAVEVLALDAETGAVRWTQASPFERDRIRHVIGVTDDRLVVSGNHLWGLDRETGRVIYPTAPPMPDPEFAGFGRGLLAGLEVYWPTRERLHRLDIRTGRPRGRQPVNWTIRGGQGGNLLIADGLLLVTEPRRLVAYGEAGLLKREAERRLAANPQSAEALLQLARAEEALEELDAAAGHYADAANLARPQDRIAGESLEDVARQHQFRLLSQLGDKLRESRDFTAAAERFAKAAEVASTPADRLVVLARLARTEADAGHVSDAMGAYQSMLSETAHRTDVDGRRVWQQAKTALAGLISQYGRTHYAAHEQAAQQRIAEAVRQEDLPSLRRLAAEYPLAAAVPTALLETAHLLARNGELQASLALWRDLLSAAAPGDNRHSALIGMAETLEQAECILSAAVVWRRLARDFPNAPLGTDHRPALEAVPRKLSSPPYNMELRHVALGEPALPLKPAWNVELSAGKRVVVPTGTPPGLAWESVLLHTPGLTCLDAVRGTVRWERPWARPVVWAGYGMAHLLVATERDLSALDLQTGSTLWSWSLDDEEPNSVHWQGVAHFVLAKRVFGITCLDADTGRVQWEFQRPGGLDESWFADARDVVLLQRFPQRRIVLDTRTGGVRSEVAESNRPWRTNPVRIRPDRFAVVDTDRRVRAFSTAASAPTDFWIYDGPMSHVHAEPLLLATDGVVLLVVDGFTASRLSPDSGTILWSQSLGWPPLADPSGSIAVEGTHLWCVHGGELSAFDINDGAPVWERLLATPSACRLMPVGRRLAVMQAESFLFCDAATGRPLQRLPSDGGRWELTECARLLNVTDDRLTAWTSQ